MERIRATDEPRARVAGSWAHDSRFAVEWRDRKMWRQDGPDRLIVTQRDNNGAAIRRGIAGNESDSIQGDRAADRFRAQPSTCDSQDLDEVAADCGIERTHARYDRGVLC